MSNELAAYTPPSSAEWQQTNELVKAVAATEFVPVAMRGKPAAVLACVLTGRELGIGPMQSLKHIAIIEGKPGLSAELMAGLVRSRGHKLRIITRAADEAEVEGIRADDPEHPVRVVWTLAMAERAGLCKIAENGWPVARDRNGKPMPWEKYPDAVLLARAISALCRALFADVLAGFSYTPEEVATDTEATWGEVELAEGARVLAEDQIHISESTLGAFEASPGAGAVTTTPAPAPATTGIIPTLEQAREIRDIVAAKRMVNDAPSVFVGYVQDAIVALHQKDAKEFWASGNLAQWQETLEYAVELHANQDAPGAVAAGGARGTTSPSGPASKGKAGGPGGDPTLDPDFDRGEGDG